MRRPVALLMFLLVLGACGGSSKSLDVAEFRSTAQELSAAAGQHQVDMTSVTSGDACQAELTRYRDAAQPMLDRMRGMSDDMDTCLRAGGQSGDADLRATCDSMYSELQRHVAQCCASSDLNVDRDEAARHAQAMEGLAQHAQDRAQMMGGMMGMSPMMSGGQCMRR